MAYKFVLLFAESSPLGLDENGKLMFSKDLGFGDKLFDVKNNFKHNPVNLYVYDDSEIIMYDKDIMSLVIPDNKDLKPIITNKLIKTPATYYRIIATTNIKLLRYDVLYLGISDKSLSEFTKLNGECEINEIQLYDNGSVYYEIDFKPNSVNNELFDLLKTFTNEFSLYRGIQILDSDIKQFLKKYNK